MTDFLGPANAPNSVTTRPGDGRSFSSLDSWFKDCTSLTSADGTQIQAAFFNGVLGALRNVVRTNGFFNDGVTPLIVENGADDGLVIKSLQNMVQRGQLIFGTDTGTAGALLVALSPALREYKAGLYIFVKVAATSAGASSINVNGLGVKAIVRRDGSPTLAGDLLANAMAILVYDGTRFMIPSAYGKATLPANLTIYVNGAIGNDANDGTANTAGYALATPQAAMNLAFSYAPSQYQITIKIADGTYGGVATPVTAGPNIVIDGNLTTPSNVILNGGVNHAVAINGPNTALVKNLYVTTSGGSLPPCGFVASRGATLNTQNTSSGPCTGAVFEAYGGVIAVGSHLFSGNSQELFWGMFGGLIGGPAGAVYTISTAITVNQSALALDGGIVSLSAAYQSFVGATNVTGAKYLASQNGIIETSGSGASFFPGTVAGSTNNGGLYV